MAATEKRLGELHLKVTNVLMEALEGDLIPGYSEENPATGEIVEVPERRLPASAAIIAAATKFLKDNEITCVRDQGNALGDLEAMMAKRRAGRATKADLAEAQEQAQFMRH